MPFQRPQALSRPPQFSVFGRPFSFARSQMSRSEIASHQRSCLILPLLCLVLNPASAFLVICSLVRFYILLRHLKQNLCECLAPSSHPSNINRFLFFYFSGK